MVGIGSVEAYKVGGTTPSLERLGFPTEVINRACVEGCCFKMIHECVPRDPRKFVQYLHHPFGWVGADHVQTPRVCVYF